MYAALKPHKQLRFQPLTDCLKRQVKLLGANFNHEKNRPAFSSRNISLGKTLNHPKEKGCSRKLATDCFARVLLCTKKPAIKPASRLPLRKNKALAAGAGVAASFLVKRDHLFGHQCVRSALALCIVEVKALTVACMQPQAFAAQSAAAVVPVDIPLPAFQPLERCVQGLAHGTRGAVGAQTGPPGALE